MPPCWQFRNRVVVPLGSSQGWKLPVHSRPSQVKVVEYVVGQQPHPLALSAVGSMLLNVMFRVAGTSPQHWSITLPLLPDDPEEKDVLDPLSEDTPLLETEGTDDEEIPEETDEETDDSGAEEGTLCWLLARLPLDVPLLTTEDTEGWLLLFTLLIVDDDTEGTLLFTLLMALDDTEGWLLIPEETTLDPDE
jgi:hypothetical protein